MTHQPFPTGKHLLLTPFATLLLTLAASGTAFADGPRPVSLGTAGNYVILAKTGISTVPPSTVTGDIAASPVAATYMTGFSLIADASNVFWTSDQLTGKAYAADNAVPAPSLLTVAVLDMEAAYTDANIFWQVAGNVALGTGSHLEGILLCKTDVSLLTRASMNGRILSQTATVLQKATVTEPK